MQSCACIYMQFSVINIFMYMVEKIEKANTFKETEFE